MTNPSAITISAGDLTFEVVMDSTGSSVGTVVLQKTVIKPGVNQMPARMKMASTDLLSLSKLLTNYLTGQNTALTVKGSMATTDIIPLQPGLSRVALTTVMAGIPPSLVVECQMKLVVLTPNIWVKFYNPLDTPYTVVAVNAEAFFYKKDGSYVSLGTLTGALSPPVTVPPKGFATSEKALPMKANLGNALAFLGLPADMKKVDLTQTVEVIVGEGFHGGMQYAQKGVPVVDRDANAALAAAEFISQYAPSNVTSIAPATTTIATPEATTSIEPTEAPATTTEVPAATTEAPAAATEAPTAEASAEASDPVVEAAAPAA